MIGTETRPIVQTLVLLPRSAKSTNIGKKREVRPPEMMITIVRKILIMEMTKGGESACLADLSR